MLPFSIKVAFIKPVGPMPYSFVYWGHSKQNQNQIFFFFFFQQGNDPSVCSNISENEDGISSRSARTALNLLSFLSLKPIQPLRKRKICPLELLSVICKGAKYLSKLSVSSLHISMPAPLLCLSTLSFIQNIYGISCNRTLNTVVL